MTEKAEPRWDLDLRYGRQGELLIGDFLAWIANGNGQVEVKRKRYLDLDFYVETECDKGRVGAYKPSGIMATEAKAWAFVIADTGISLILPTLLLRQAMEASSTRRVEEKDGSCPTRGVLVNLAAILAAARRNAT